MGQPNCNRDSLVCPAITWAEKEIGRLRASLCETLAEVVEIRKNITDARQHNYEAIAHPKFDETYQREMARMDAMIERARNALTHEQEAPQKGVIFLTGAFSDHLDSKFKDEQKLDSTK